VVLDTDDGPSAFEPADNGGADEYGWVVDCTLLVARRQSTPLFEPIDEALDGLITNDKFCFVRFLVLPLSWWRRPLRMRTLSLQSRGFVHAGGTDETRMEHPSPLRGEDQQPDPLGSGVSAALALDDQTSGGWDVSRLPKGGV